MLEERLLVKQWSKLTVDFNSTHSMSILQIFYEDLPCTWHPGWFIGCKHPQVEAKKSGIVYVIGRFRKVNEGRR